MTKLRTPLAVASVAALFSLAACGQSEPEVVGGMAEGDDGDIEELDPADLPAMERASQSYRCDDGSVVYVTFYTNDTQVGVRSEQEAPQTILENEAAAAAAEGDTEADEEAVEAADGPLRFSGEGQTLVGTGSTITYNGQSCNS